MGLNSSHCYRRVQVSRTISLNLKHATDYITSLYLLRPAHQPKCQPRDSKLGVIHWRFMPITSPFASLLRDTTVKLTNGTSPFIISPAENWMQISKTSSWISIQSLGREMDWTSGEKVELGDRIRRRPYLVELLPKFDREPYQSSAFHFQKRSFSAYRISYNKLTGKLQKRAHPQAAPSPTRPLYNAVPQLKQTMNVAAAPLKLQSSTDPSSDLAHENQTLRSELDSLI